jgi:hypothetical protein
MRSCAAHYILLLPAQVKSEAAYYSDKKEYVAEL